MVGKTDNVKQSQENNIEKPQRQDDEGFVHRVSSIPIVKDSVTTAQSIASKTFIGRFALSTASSVTNYAVNNQPTFLSNYYQRADALGCRSLDLIQEKVPMINQPSSDIIQAVTPYQIIDGVKVRIDTTLRTVTQPAHVVVHEANKRFGVVVDNVEGVIGKYLPNNEKEVNGTGEKQDNDDESTNQAVRAYKVLNNASRRISHRMTEQVSRSTAGIPRSRQDLARLAETHSLVQSASHQLQILQETLKQSIQVYTQAAQDRIPASVSARVQQVSQLIDNLKAQTQQVPEWLKQRIDSVIEATHQQLGLIRAEFNRTDVTSLEKVKHVAASIQTQIVPLLQNIQSQLASYTELVRQKAQHDLNVPLHYFGLNQKIKTQ
jgi:hypothetical protein